MTSVEEGATPLMYACQQSKEKDVLDILAKKPAAARETDRTRKTALHYCAENLNTACAEALLRTTPNIIDARDEDGYSPLHLAVIAGNKPFIQLLLSRGADVNALDNEKHSVVHWATVCGEQEALEMVLRARASVSSADIHGGYPLHYAAQMCGPGADVRGDTRAGLSVLRTLLAYGADVDDQDRDGRQPILWAASAGSAEAILALVKAGASVGAADKDGLTALHCAASRGHTDCLETLVGLCGADVDTIDVNGCTALFYAVTLGHADATQLLLSLGAEPNRQDRKGRTPAHCGAAKGQLETLRLLLARGANLWLRNVKGDLPLHEAVASGRRELVQWLLNQRPHSVNVANNDGKCPIHVAAINNNVDMLKILLDFGSLVNPVLRSNKGLMMTPLDAALHRGHRSCAKFLQLHGGVPRTKLTEITAALRGTISREALGSERSNEQNLFTRLPATTANVLSPSPRFSGDPESHFEADNIAIRHIERIEVPPPYQHRDQRYKGESSDDDQRYRRRRRRRRSERRKNESLEEEDSNDSGSRDSSSRPHRKSSRRRSRDDGKRSRTRSNEKEKSRSKRDKDSSESSSESSTEARDKKDQTEEKTVESNKKKHRSNGDDKSSRKERKPKKSGRDASTSNGDVPSSNNNNNSHNDSNVQSSSNGTNGEKDNEGNKERKKKSKSSNSEKNEDVKVDEDVKLEDPLQHIESPMSQHKLSMPDSSLEDNESNMAETVEVSAEVHHDATELDLQEPNIGLKDNEPLEAKLHESHKDEDEKLQDTEIAYELSGATSNNSKTVPSIEHDIEKDEPEITNEKNETVDEGEHTHDMEGEEEYEQEFDEETPTPARSMQRRPSLTPSRATMNFEDGEEVDNLQKSPHTARSDEVDEDGIPINFRQRRQSLVFGEEVSGNMGDESDKKSSKNSGRKGRRRGSIFTKTESEEHEEMVLHMGDVDTVIKDVRLGDTEPSFYEDSGGSTRNEDSSALPDSGIEPSPRREKRSPSASPRRRIPRLCRTGREQPVTPVSVTRAVQNTIRKYHLERKIFYQLLELKRLQIRAGRANEQVLVKRLVDEYQRTGQAAGLQQYNDVYGFQQFERFLYEQLHMLQAGTQLVIPQLKPSDDIENLSAILKRTRVELLDDIPDNPSICTHGTHRCHHAAHAYTGVPCAAYITKLNHHTMPKVKHSGFLPRIDTASISRPSSRKSDRPVTLELINGREKQVISLPTERLDRSKRYYVTFTIKGGPSPPQTESPGHHHAESF